MGEETFLHADDENHRKLQALGGMEGNQCHRIDLLIVAIDIGNQSHTLKKGGEAILGRQVAIIIRYGTQLQDILPPILPILPLQDIFFVSGALQHQVEKLDNVKLTASLDQFVKQGEEIGEHPAGPGVKVGFFIPFVIIGDHLQGRIDWQRAPCSPSLQLIHSARANPPWRHINDP
ncbi:hypothetical protein ES703_109011 [subsurface metagenome]